MADVFAWVPRVEASGDKNARVLDNGFGDGYMQSIPDGLNAVVATWNLQFVNKVATITAIDAFLEAHAGISFLYTNVLGVQKLYQCKTWSIVGHGKGNASLSATFEQRFQP